VVAATVDIGADELAPRSLLYSDRATLSVQTGGTVKFTIEAGASRGGNVFILLPGLSGTHPGTQLGSVHVPLNVDAITLLLVPALPGLVGLLDTAGMATTSVPFTGPLPSALAGRDMSFAALFLVPNSRFTGASNDETLRYVPKRRPPPTAPRG
jgi:hypothetical protein